MYWNENPLYSKDIYNMININMRCIEIERWITIKYSCLGLTLTWDVLKCAWYTHNSV